MDGPPRPNPFRKSQQEIAKWLSDNPDFYSNELSSDSANVSPKMAAPGNRQHVVHQDYIVRQRYSNALPPPPGAPKLLEIPTQGLSAYCHPSYAQRLARATDLNIEADAMLGMPIDLVGMPGIFDGDESSIQAPLVTPPVHPRDRALLRPLKTLGQPKSDLSGVSFLRRTQYVAEDQRRAEAAISRKSQGSAPKPRRKVVDPAKNDDVTVLREAVKGFDIANPEDAYKGPDNQTNIRGAVPTLAENEAWKNPKHPSNHQLKLIASYPILPDLSGYTDEGGYMVVKLAGQPTDVTEGHDKRMDAALLHAVGFAPEALAEYLAKQAAHDANPDIIPAPSKPGINYEFFLPEDERTAANVKQKTDVHNPNRDDPELYTHNTKGGAENDSFRYNHIRDYETGLQNENTDKYQELAIVLDKSTREPGNTHKSGSSNSAFYYPIVSKSQLKPRRGFGMSTQGTDDHETIDRIDLTIREPDEHEAAKRAEFKAATVEDAPGDEHKVA
ncbi:hypothetical protein MMC11_002833 [Xylographa trunciseda]|nr:hypothetical protein [Xylographa trunciseda]